MKYTEKQYLFTLSQIIFQLLTMNSSSSSENDMLTPELVKVEANNVINNLLPPKSKAKYLKAYENFCVWKNSKGAKSFSETVFLAYFQEISKYKQPSTLWSIYSMLKATVSLNNNIQINLYAKLIAFLKRLSEGHKTKKSRVLSAENVDTFLNEAPDDSFLAVKVSKFNTGLPVDRFDHFSYT